MQRSRKVQVTASEQSYCSRLHVNPRHVHSTFQPLSQLENLNNQPITKPQSRHVTAGITHLQRDMRVIFPFSFRNNYF